MGNKRKQSIKTIALSKYVCQLFSSWGSGDPSTSESDARGRVSLTPDGTNGMKLYGNPSIYTGNDGDLNARTNAQFFLKTSENLQYGKTYYVDYYVDSASSDRPYTWPLFRLESLHYDSGWGTPYPSSASFDYTKTNTTISSNLITDTHKNINNVGTISFSLNQQPTSKKPVNIIGFEIMVKRSPDSSSYMSYNTATVHIVRLYTK